jgi:Extensin-like protein C-terminus
MTRGVRWYLVGSLVLVVLAGCGRQAWFGEREPWRREAEVACLKSGAVREGPAIAILKPIQGPGMCGADYPLKVAVLGELPITGYADDVARPPNAIPQYSPAYPPPPMTSAAPAVAPNASSRVGAPYSPDPLYAPTPDPYPRTASPNRTGSTATPGAPLSLTPPGLDPSLGEAPPYPSRAAMPTSTIPLGPARGPPVTGSIGPTSVNPPATLTCPIVSALDHWITEAVQPAALHWFGQPVAEIKQISAYSCRGMNGDSNAHISEHAFGNALDIAAFTLTDGRRITVKDGWHGLPEEQGFLRDVQGAACQQFSTVLAPGANVYHYDHIHVDLMRRSSGRQICEPAAMRGETAAAHARARYAARRSDDASVTGSVGPHQLPRPPTRLPSHEIDDEDYYENHPQAVPGED